MDAWNILVTGSNGLVGSAAVEYFARRGFTCLVVTHGDFMAAGKALLHSLKNRLGACVFRATATEPPSKGTFVHSELPRHFESQLLQPLSDLHDL